jgi:hypothetical protein
LESWGAEPIHRDTVPIRPIDDNERALFRDRAAKWGVQVVASAYILPEVEAMLDTLQAAGVLVVRSFGCSDIVQGRCTAATWWHDEAKEHGRETLLWIDSDTWIHPVSALRLLAAAEAAKGLVTACSPSRGTRRVLPVIKDTEQRWALGVKGELVPVLYAGFGCVAHPLFVLTILEAHSDVYRVSAGFVTFFAPVLEYNNITRAYDYLAEDYAFWHRIGEVGIPRFMDPEHRVIHYGQWPYQWEDNLFDVRPLFQQIPIGGPFPADEPTATE